MTALLTQPESPGQSTSMPGWHVVANLTPPELINARRLVVIRRRLVVALTAVVLLCGAGYFYAMQQYNSASDTAGAASAQTTDLTRAATKYNGITRIETMVDTLHGQVASVMQGDVDVAHEIAVIRAALPDSMSIQSLGVTLTPSSAAGAAAPVGLNTSGQAEIGTVTITGSGRTLDDLSAYVDRLVATPGVVNVLPGSNAMAAGTATFSLTFSLTNKLYSHRYNATNTGGK